ncbi:acyl-CoA dehydrogenase [Hoyosella rhizosphaerae]|uniref:Broad-specificity linear acyl-CoA dehydrogenase FadE5 n=1 Tax=Hoyosella rhizosphaerae TaxID=1755582 RepID=A0A916XEC2_9ACTN|nr:acyl-CoA dehydrogenase [Hoyosella rhizosphaerae]MBN4925821.1 acyl-CoA dehydrogenase [Hoyosella rhizosphaerae]GGC67689.1 acyl-CoA dehydrogenase [Hoyosella rhizosphaerae]
MGHYRSNVRDLEFNLFESLHLDAVLATGAYGDLDGDTVREIVAEASRLAEGPIADPFAEADRNPPVFNPETHSVELPAGLKKVIKTWHEAEYFRIGLAPAIGGEPAPSMLGWAIKELILGAQPTAYMYLAGPKAADIVHGIGNDLQKHWANLAIERNWGATMVLTEPDAGSDVGAGRTKAVEQPDGTWHIEGVKRFITSADSDDLFENILHMVLARPEGAGPGTKGLSLFLVPKFHFDHSTGVPGERNGVFVTNVEHKMGIKASATCELTFGQHGTPAVGWLVGDVHNGIAQMFRVIEEARMMVGTKAISTLSTGYLNALDYAKQREQGSDMTEMTKKDAPRVPITRHPDVRRSLMLQKAYAEGLRAVYLYTAAHQDDAVAQIVSGADADMAARVNDFLLPIVKGVGSERAYQLLSESLQVLGGSGFLQDYPIEQYIRDSKIDSLYEGTTAIQSQDFFFRKIARDQGKALSHIAGQITAFLDDPEASPSLVVSRDHLRVALNDVQAALASMFGHLMGAKEDPKALYKIGLGSVRLLMAVGDLIIGWQLLRHAEIALKALDGEPDAKDRAFYQGKVASAKFFAANVLPVVAVTSSVLANIDDSIMDLDEAAF